jgi:ParB-like nuclease family protein
MIGKVTHARLSGNGQAEEELIDVSIYDIKPSPENSKLYRPPSEDDTDIVELSESLKKDGFFERIVISADNYIISGHRRHAAADLAGLRTVPCRRMVNIKRGDGEKASDEFVKLLREHNRQRVKTNDELMHEAIIDTNPEDAYRELTMARKRKSKIKAETFEIREHKARKEISEAKMPFLRAVQNALRVMADLLPLTVRFIHYYLLNDPPLKHASKPDSVYCNDDRSYASLIDLVTRARHEGYIDYDDIEDPTRPVIIPDTYQNLGEFYQKECDQFLAYAKRDLMQSQPNHIEIIVEKNSLGGVFEPITWQYGKLPLQIGRGQCSTTPIYNIAKRYRNSGKENLILIIFADLDPSGDCIAESIPQRLCDDHGIKEKLIKPIRAGLTMEQVRELNLPPSFQRAKRGKGGSPQRTIYNRYVAKYGSDRVWELEALITNDVDLLQRMLKDHIDAVLDTTAFNKELAIAKQDAVHIVANKKMFLQFMKSRMLDFRF